MSRVVRVRELKKGVKPGDDVQRCQVLLRDLGFFPSGRKTGRVYGLETRKAVRAFKRRNRLNDDGTCGRLCWEALERQYARKHRKAVPRVEMRSPAARRRASDRLWGGSRAVTNEVIDIVDGRVATGSRKRWETFGNPSSDHHVLNRTADAVDLLTANNYALAREIARELGGEWSGDYDSFVIRRRGNSYRVQMIAGTHGTGPHLHVGVRRV